MEAKIGRWSARDLAFVESVQFSGIDSTLRIDALFQCRGAAAWPDTAKPMFRVVLQFKGVFGLSLSNFGGERTQISGFYINDISDRGWDTGRLEVGDYEEGRLKFFADDVEICSDEEPPEDLGDG